MDRQTPMGVATGRTLDRVCAALGVLEAAPLEFEAADDVPMGGVLCALPALLEVGLLRHTRTTFSLPKGFYPIESIFLVLAYLALARVRSLEELRYQAPGEWGRLLGLDRIPEVKTMREKIELLCTEPGRAQRWSGMLAKEWMDDAPEAAGTLYVDGHVRVYHGNLTKLPRRYVARQKLLLRGTTDYWVNAMDGQPFFVVTQTVDPGIQIVIREEIVPRLIRDVPGQPTEQELKDNPLLHRFTLVFDRAGFSPKFFEELREQRIAILTYNKYPGTDWQYDEFVTRPVTLANGEQVTLDLAERGTQLSNGLWVRELRRRDRDGHQTSVISTNYISALERGAAAMFARWTQENFFKYMIQHFGLDRLIEYGTERLPETTKLVNPAWRKLDSQVRKQTGSVARDRVRFAEMSPPNPPPFAHTSAYERKLAAFEKEKGEFLQSIEARERQIAELKAQRKATPKHVAFSDLPEEERFYRLKADKKHFVDTIKMIAYRAETALVHLAREHLSRGDDDARAFVRSLLTSAVDLRPDQSAKTLRVRLHLQATAAQDAAIDAICRELSAAETVVPGTDLRLVFEPVFSASEAPSGAAATCTDAA
jgi:hypothetical protein